ncbi:hypothetical protein [Micromonospora tulbaghiae]
MGRRRSPSTRPAGPGGPAWWQAVRAGVAAVLNDLTGIVIWLDRH